MTDDPREGTGSEFKVDGSELVARLKEIIHQGNVRNIVIRSEKGRTILELPLTLGAAGALMAPPYIMLGVLAALIGKCTISVTRGEPAHGEDGAPDQNV
jgi:hypothetical protein